MKPGTALLARVYCGLAAGALIWLGLAAWQAGRDNIYLGAMLCGVGLFMIAGLFGGTTRLLAMVGLCIVFALLSFAFSLGMLVLRQETPDAGIVSVWATELIAAALGGVLARRMYGATIG